MISHLFVTICSVFKEEIVSKSTCEFWFRRFKDSDFDVSERERSGEPLKSSHEDMQALLDEEAFQTQKQTCQNI